MAGRAIIVAAAVIGAAAIGAVATTAASSSAASATTNATNASIAAQESAQQRQAGLNAPYAAIGTGSPGIAGQPGTSGAIQQYQNLLGLGPQGTAGIEASLAATPGYQFAKNQGMQATLNAATLTNPGGVSGNTLQALDRFSTGLADSTYQQALGNAQNAVTIGQNAAAGTGSGILQTGANVGNALINQGSTIAGIDANQAAGLSKVASGAASNYATLNTLNNLNSNPGFTSQDYATMSQPGFGQPGTYTDSSGYTLNTPGLP